MVETAIWQKLLLQNSRRVLRLPSGIVPAGNCCLETLVFAFRVFGYFGGSLVSHDGVVAPGPGAHQHLATS